jgi:hypothetical protein
VPWQQTTRAVRTSTFSRASARSRVVALRRRRTPRAATRPRLRARTSPRKHSLGCPRPHRQAVSRPRSLRVQPPPRRRPGVGRCRTSRPRPRSRCLLLLLRRLVLRRLLSRPRLLLPLPPPAAASPGMDMDWDDEDEATHIFDKADDVPGALAASSPRPAAGSFPTPAPAAGKSTLLGMTAPMQATAAPSQRPMPPPPPPSVGGAFARASSLPSGAPGPSALPPPPTIQPMIPPAAPTQQGIGGTMPMQPPGMGPQSYPPPRPPGYPPPPQQMHMPAQAMDYGQPRPPSRMEATAVVHPPQSRTGLWIALVAILVLLGGALGAFFLVPRAGRIAVNVTDAKGNGSSTVDIFVDGRKKCDRRRASSTRCRAGSHDVKVARGRLRLHAVAVHQRRVGQGRDGDLLPVERAEGERPQGRTARRRA